MNQSDRRKNLSVIYTSIQCDRIIFFLGREDNGWDMPDQQDQHTEKQSSQTHYDHLHIYYSVIILDKRAEG